MSILFLSHSSRDDATAGELRDWLASEGHEALFLDHDQHDGIAGGEVWEERLYTELRRCRALIALVSPAWLASPWCVAEANHAQALRKAVIPLRIAEVDRELYTCMAPPVLRRVQEIDWRTGEEAKVRLRDALLRAGLDPKNLFPWKGDREPYPGLAAFDRADAPVYFGREQEITDLLAILNGCRAPDRARFVVVQGASGTGKSSLVRAGVLSRLERDPDHWLIVPPFRPLRQPLRELVDALTLAAGIALPEPPPENPAAPKDHTAWARWIVATAGDLRLRKGLLDATVLLTIDQLEEAVGRPEGDVFLLALRDALATADHRLLGLATLRADFSAALQRHPALSDPTAAREILRTQTYQLGPLPRHAFHEVIEGPAELVGLKTEPGLTSRLVDEARTDDALPLLAFVLREMWDQYGKADLTFTQADYDAFGGLEKAVGSRAEQIFTELMPSGPEVEAFRTILLFGMADLSGDGRIVRRPMPLAEVPVEAQRLVDEFTQARLLSKGTDFVEVTHEALFRRWDRLVEWIRSGMDDLRARQRVESAYRAWLEERQDRDSRLLPRGQPLAEAEDLLWRRRGTLSLEVVSYIEASTAVERARQDADRQRLERERVEAEERAEAARRVARRTRVAAAVIAVLAVLAAGFGGYSYVAQQRAVAAEQAAGLERDRAISAETEAVERLARLCEQNAAALRWAEENAGPGIYDIRGMLHEFSEGCAGRF